MNNNYEIKWDGIGLGMQGFYRVQVVDATTKEVTSDYGWHHNLILNNGMDAVASVGLCYLNAVGIAGTGSRPNSITSSTSTITQSANMVYLYERTGLSDFTSSYSTYTSSVNIGDVLIYGNLSQSTVIAIIDGYNLQVNTSYTIDAASSQSFTIWKTSQAGLEKEMKRSGVYLQGSSSILGFNCGTVTSGSTKIFRRTYDFTTEVSQSDYSEIGVSWSGTPNDGVFSRALLPLTASVPIGSQLRLTHDLMVSFTPDTIRYVEPTITGWTNTKGTESIQNFSMPDVLTTGGVNYGGYGIDRGVFDPSSFAGYNYNTYYCIASISDVDTAPAAFNTYVARYLDGSSSSGNGSAGGILTYVPGSYMVYKYSTIGVGYGNSSNIRSIAMGTNVYTPVPDSGQKHVIVFDVPHEKTNLQIMSVTYKFSWSRIIQ